MATLTIKLRKQIIDLRQARYGLHHRLQNHIVMSTDMLTTNANNYTRAQVQQYIKTLNLLISNTVCQ